MNMWKKTSGWDREQTMKKKLAILPVCLVAAALIGCATVKGTVMGAGVGYLFGDAEMGAQIGATAGLIKDIWD